MAGHHHPTLRLRAKAHGGGKPIRLVRHGDVPQQQLRRFQDTGGICIVALAVGNEAGGRAVDGFKHGIPATGVGAARRADTALNLGSLIGNDIAVQVWQYEHLKFAADLRVHQIGGHDINIPILGGDLRVIRRHLMADAGEHPVGFLHDVGLGDNGHVGLAVGTGKLKGGSGNPAGTGVRCDLEIHAEHIRDLDAPAAQRVLALRIFPEKRPVDPGFRDGHRPHIGEEIQLPAHGHVGAFQRAALGGLRGTFQQDVAALHGFQHVVGDRLALSGAVFDGQAVNVPQLHPAAGNFRHQQLFQHPAGLGHNDGTDAVAGDQADDDVFHVGKVPGRGSLCHPFLPVKLLGQQGAEMLRRVIEDFLIICHQSLPSFV